MARSFVSFFQLKMKTGADLEIPFDACWSVSLGTLPVNKALEGEKTRFDILPWRHFF